MQRKCSGFPVFACVSAVHSGFMGGFESFWGRKNNPPELVLYQHQAGFYFLVLLVIRRIRAQVTVDHVDDLFDRFLV